MIVKHKLQLDLVKRDMPQRIQAMQDDRYSRELEICLLAGGMEYLPPEDATVLVRYQKPDGTGGAYDTLPNGSSAWSVENGVLTVALAPQVCTAPGTVELAVSLLRETAEISTFTLLVDVMPAPGGKASSREYVNIQAFMPQPGNLKAGQYLMVKEVDAYGNATAIGCGAGGAASVEIVGAEGLEWNAAPQAKAAPGSTDWNRKYILGIPAGAPGYSPVRGLDYWTAEDYSVMQQENRAYLLEELAKRGVVSPLFASDIADCTDESRLYVLPDGYIYSFFDGSWQNSGHIFMPRGEKGAPGKDGTDIVACSYAYAVLPAGRAKGDVNGDGVVDAKDSELIRSYRAGTATIDDEISLWAAEIDGNGKVDAYDAYLIDVHQNGGAVLTQFAADYYNNWHYDTEDRFYYYDIAVAGMTAGCGATVIPSVSFGPGFMKAVTMDGFMRLCFQACPTQDILCRILYGGKMEGVTVENGVENSFLDAGAMKTQEIVNEVLAALPTWDGGMY